MVPVEIIILGLASVGLALSFIWFSSCEGTWTQITVFTLFIGGLALLVLGVAEHWGTINGNIINPVF